MAGQRGTFVTVRDIVVIIASLCVIATTALGVYALVEIRARATAVVNDLTPQEPIPAWSCDPTWEDC